MLKRIAVVSFLSFVVVGGTTVVGCGGGEPEPQTPVGGGAPSATPTAASATATTAEPTAHGGESTANHHDVPVEQHRAHATAAFAARDWAKAKAALKAILAKDANDVAAHTMLGGVHAEENNAAGAADEYLAASKADQAKDEQLALTAAKALNDLGRFDDVIGLMQLATKAHDKSMPAWMYLAMAQVDKGDAAAGAESYTKLTEAFADEPQLWARLAVAQQLAGKTAEAKKTAKLALSKWVDARAPKSKKEVRLGKGPVELAMIARAMRRSGDAAAALAALTKYNVAKDETAPLLDVERGLAKRAKKDMAGAKADADRASKAGGAAFAPAHVLAAAIAADQKRADDAQSELKLYRASRDRTYETEAKEIEHALSGGK